MAASKIARARLRGRLIQLGSLVVSVPVALLNLAIILLAANNAPAGAGVVFAMGVAFGSIGTTVVLPAMVLGGLAILVRAWRLDPAFAALSRGKQVSLVGRGWVGEHAGRQVNAWFSKGPQIEIYVAGDTGAVAGVGQDSRMASFAARAFGLESFEVGDYVAGGRDLDWTRRWLEQPGVREALDVLLAEDGRTLRSVAVLPDCVRFVARFVAYSQVTPEATAAWMAAATTCVVAAEAVGPPMELQEPGLGSRLRTYRGGLWVGCVVVLATLLLIAVIVGGVAVVIALAS